VKLGVKDGVWRIEGNGVVLGEPFRPTEGTGDLVTYRKEKTALKIASQLSIDVEEARLYTKALSAAEIAASYRAFKK